MGKHLESLAWSQGSKFGGDGTMIRWSASNHHSSTLTASTTWYGKLEV